MSSGPEHQADVLVVAWSAFRGPKPDELAAARRLLRPGGRLLVLGWCLPSSLDDLATLHGQLITGVALDEALHGGRLRTVEEHALLFAAAGLPAPEAIRLPSDAVLLVAERPS